MVPIEHEVYARWADGGTRLGLGILTATFLAYVFGVVEPLVPPPELSRLWVLPVDRYLAASGGPTGWGWLQLIDKGDYANLAGVAVIGLVTVLSYLRIIPLMLERGERLHAWLAVGQVLVLLAAASGLFSGGH